MTQAQSTPTPQDALAAVVLRTLARKAEGLTGADIERLVREARQKARRQQRPLSYGDLESVLVGAKPERSMLLRSRMAVHEAGHAVSRILLGFGAITEITIDAPGGGYISGGIGQDEMTEEQLTAVLISTLAGRAAEEVMRDSVSAHSGGAGHSDLALATALALEMETVLGFGQKWPLLYRKTKDATAEFAADPDLAERVNARLDSAYGVVRKIVHEQREAIDALAEQLFDQGTLEGPELDAVLDDVRRRIKERQH
jgi:cell division protease FtsH